MNDYISTMRKKIGKAPLMIVGAGVIIYKDGKILLHKRADNGCWSQYGGCLELGETVEEGAKRELFEESGLIANALSFLGVFSGEELHFKYPNGDEVYVVAVVYECSDFTGELIEKNDEVLEQCWFSIDSLPKDINPSDKSIINSFIESKKTTNTNK